jgi:hypothetical protein
VGIELTPPLRGWQPDRPEVDTILRPRTGASAWALGTQGAIELDPDYDKPHYQLISAHSGLQQPEVPVAVYERRLAASPGELRHHRFLASVWVPETRFRLQAGRLRENGQGSRGRPCFFGEDVIGRQ